MVLIDAVFDDLFKRAIESLRPILMTSYSSVVAPTVITPTLPKLHPCQWPQRALIWHASPTSSILLSANQIWAKR